MSKIVLGYKGVTVKYGSKGMLLYTEISGKELYEEGKNFFAESTAVYASEDSEVYEIEVEGAVKLQIQYEVDGVTVYNVKPEQVIDIKKIK